MKEDAGLITSVLMPVIDTYKDAAAALIGCHSFGIERESCELDILLVTNEERPSTSVRSGDRYFDLIFLNERGALNPSRPELAVAIAHAKPVKDANLIISTSIAANQALLETSLNSSAQGRLASCLKALGRADDSMTKGDLRVANYWLLSASSEFAFAWLFSLGVNPSPSHVISQLKRRTRGSAKDFEAFSLAAGLNRASRRECAARLEGLSLLYDLMGTRQQTGSILLRSSTEVAFQIVKRKAEYLAGTIEHTESYSFLGMEVAKLIMSVSSSRDPRMEAGNSGTLGDVLSQGRSGLLSDKLVRDLGLLRPEQEVRTAISACQDRVAKMARRI